MIPSVKTVSVLRRTYRLLAPLCIGATFLALAVAACSVPHFEFPDETATNAAGQPGAPDARCDDKIQNGSETDVDCGGDCAACLADQSCKLGTDCVSGTCNAGACGTECADGYADCNEQNDDACEVNLKADADNCSGCGLACQLSHAQAECSAGECRVAAGGCADGYADCNGDPTDGCEIDLQRDKLNCGACDKVCTGINGAPFCADGTCQITCEPGFADCDDKRENGCERNVTKDVNHCGDCDSRCTPESGGTPYCKDGACGETNCPAGFGDCNGDPDDGCEVDLRTDPENCDSCGNLCLGAHASATCSNRVCKIASCESGFADCSGGYADGCETNVNTDTANCGGCGKACRIAGGSPECVGGACAIGSCSGTHRDCNGSAKDGCELDIATTSVSCGGCGAAGVDCTSKYPNATASCSGGACSAPVCDDGFDDCNGVAADGCEKDVTSDKNNCGACGVVCSATHAASPSCSAGQCKPACDEGWAACGKPEQGCTTPLGTSTDCSKCGDACPASAPFCNSGACADHRDIVLVNSSTHALSGWDGGANVLSQIAISHALETGKGNDRMLLVGLGATDTFTNPEKISLTYDGVAMTPAIKVFDSANQHTLSAIYYLLDAALPDAPGSKQVVASFGANYTWGHGGIQVLELKNTMQVAPIATSGAAGPNSCSATMIRSASISFNQAGSLVYGLLTARGATGATLGASAGLTELWKQNDAKPENVEMATAYSIDDAARTMTWTVTDCFNSAVALAAVKRLNYK